MTEAWDFVIVGGGTAGCVLANRLSADARNSVLLIEAGPNDRSPYIHIPAGLMRLSGMHWGYEDEPDASRMDQSMTWMAGKVLGGGSSVNGMIWARGNRADFDEWSDLGCDGWDFASVLPFFKRCERFAGGADGYRGGDGPQHVGFNRAPHVLTDSFIAAADAQGYGITRDYNGETQTGVGVAQTAQWRGFRQSEARAYLPPRVRMRKNLTIMTDTFVRRILFDGTRATGVELDGANPRVTARREVIVSAGALASPKILMTSGIGPADHLREFGIDVIADVAGVGKNLQEHPILTMMWNVNISTFNMDLTPKMMVRHGIDFAVRGKGAAAAAAGHALVFAPLREGSSRPDIELLFAPFGMVGKDAGDTDSAVLESAGEHDVTQMELLRRPSVSVIVQLLHPHSRGEILLRSGNPIDKPIIKHSLLGDENDVADLIAAGKITRQILAQPSIAKYVIGEALPGPIVEGDDMWAGYAHYGGWGAQHPVGTNKMGTDAMAVVDPQLRVRGVSGLRVVDASVMPTITSGNTNAPTVMIAEKAAEMILTRQ